MRGLARWVPVLVLAGLVAGISPVFAQEEAPADTADAAETEEQDEFSAGQTERVTITVSVEGDNGQMSGLGSFVIELDRQTAPQHVDNFLKLVKEKYYVDSCFHRIVPGFIVQGGDPISKTDWRSPLVGTGGPGYTVPAELGGKHVRGAVAMARKSDSVNPNQESSGSQFYICLADLPALDRGSYSVFGKVVEGMDVVDKIARIKNAGSENNNRALQRVIMTQLRASQ